MKVEDDLHLFKYRPDTRAWDNPIVHECRGTIARRATDGTWSLCSRPFDKFFNRHQGHCPVFCPDALAEALLNAHLVEKADGTCIQVWHDDVQDMWRASTLGAITPHNVGEQNYTFADLFWKIGFPTGGTHRLLKDLTYIFELCCDENRIVTKYPKPTVVFLGGRYLNDGTHDDLLWIPEHVRHARHHNCADLGITNLEDLNAWIEAQSTKPHEGEQYPEGYVLFDDASQTPLAKLKNTRYLALHHGTGAGDDLKCSKKRVTAAVCTNTIDDIYEPLTDRLKAHADQVRVEVRSLHQRVWDAFVVLKYGEFETRKELAAAVQEVDVPSPVRSLFFTHAKAILSTTVIDVDEAFYTWLAENHERLEWGTSE